MRRALFICFIVLAGFLIVQCNPSTFSLFAGSLPTTTHTASAADLFTHRAGEKFYFYAMRANGAINTDCVYVVQALPGGNRKLAVYDGTLNLKFSGDLPTAGRGHLPLPPISTNQMTGGVILGFDYTPVTVSQSPVFPGDPDNYLAFANTGTTGFEFWIDNTATATALYWRWGAYDTSGHTFTDANTGPPLIIAYETGHRYTLEAIASDAPADTAYLVLRDLATNEGFVAACHLSAGSLAITESRPIGRRIVPDTVSAVEDHSFMLQTDDGNLRRVYSDGHVNDDFAPGDVYNGSLMACGSENMMYLFNTATFGLQKCRSWWEIEW